MRIDLNPKPPAAQDAGKPADRSVSKSSIASESAVKDEAQFSSHAARIDALEKHINELPEIRQSRVEPLRTAIESGRYNVSSAKIADAIFAAMISRG